MTRFRFSDPPKEIEDEAMRLAQEYLNQFSDDDEVPDDGIYEYSYQHASKALRDYFDEISKLREEAKRNGTIIG